MELHDAARRGDIAALTALLDAGRNIDERVSTRPKHGPYFCQLTPFMEATQAGDKSVATLQFLLSRGANPRATSEAGASALHYAAMYGDAPAVRYLLDLGLDPEQKSFSGATPLLLMLQGLGACDPQCLRNLLDRGANASARGVLTQGALHLAAARGNAACVEMLLEAGVEVDSRDGRGRTPLMCVKGAAVARALLRAGADPHAVESEERLPALVQNRGLEARPSLPPKSAVTFAVLSDSDALRAFVEHGVDLRQAEREFGFSYMTIACTSGSIESFEVLLEQGFSWIDDATGSTVLHMGTVRENADRWVQVLRERGENIDERDRYGKTPLHTAADRGNASLVRALLSHGARRDATTHGWTALGLAQRPRSVPSSLQGLLKNTGRSPGDRWAQAGVSSDALAAIEAQAREKHACGETLTLGMVRSVVDDCLRGKFEWIRIAVADDVLARLTGREDERAKLLERLATDTAAGKQAAIEELKRAGLDAATIAEDDVPAVHAVVDELDFEAVRALLESGASVESASREGNRPLHVCNRRATDAEARARMTRLLVERGARLEARQGAGATPLLLAAEHGSFFQLKTLIELGADPKAMRNSGDSSLDAVVARKQCVEPDRKVELLLACGVSPLSGCPRSARAIKRACAHWNSFNLEWTKRGAPAPARPPQAQAWRRVVDLLMAAT